MAAIPAVNAIAQDAAAIRSLLDSWQSRIALKKVGRGHHYTVDGAKKGAASVTTKIGCRVSPRLIDWSSRVEREACIETAWRMAKGGGAFGLEYAGGILPDEAHDAFVERFTAEAGQERENQRQLKEAGAFGTEVHTLIEWHLRTKLGEDVPEPSVSDRALTVFGNFEQWAKAVDLEPVAMEFRLFHTGLNYGGTGDLAAFLTIPGKPRRLGIGDFKTSKGVWPEMRVQSGAYRAAWEAMGLPPAMGFLLHLPKEGPTVGTVECIEVDEPLDELMDVFLTHSKQHAFYGRYR